MMFGQLASLTVKLAIKGILLSICRHKIPKALKLWHNVICVYLWFSIFYPLDSVHLPSPCLSLHPSTSITASISLTMDPQLCS
jgi:hypothetical protein